MTELSQDSTSPRSGDKPLFVRTHRFRLLRTLKRDPLAMAGIVIVLAFVAFALFPSQLALHDPAKQNLRARFIPPFWMEEGMFERPLGTDPLGRDLLSRIIFGARVSLVVATSAVLVSGSFGVVLGLISGFLGGLADNIIMAVTEIQLSFPYLLLAILIIAILGPNLQNLILVLALSGWTVYSKLVRAQVLSLREEEYVLAVRAIGASTPRIVFRHILPQMVGPLIVVATLEMARLILLEAALTFLGLGVQPPNLSWGIIMSDGRGYLASAWWICTFSGVAVMLTTLAINSLGNWLSDALDPMRRIIK